MKRLRGTAALLCALLGFAAGCASSTPDPTVKVADDATITAGVRAALARDPVLSGAEIDVATAQGVVQLSGFVSSADDVAAAAAAARSVTGVTSVRNDLRLK